MQIPSLDVRELSPDEPLRADELEITREQADRVAELKALNAELDARRADDLAGRPRRSRGSRRRR